MLCALCGSVGRMRVGDGGRMRRGSDGPAEDPELATCEVCGHQAEGGAGRVVETLASLARFGLTGQAILARRRS